jgi:hypothetical protein
VGDDLGGRGGLVVERGRDHITAGEEFLLIPHYDGARGDAAEPAVIVVSGVGPVRQAWVDSSQPVLRQL